MYCDFPQLGRCCFCMPLRRGVLVLGYLNIFFSAFMIGLYSHAIHYPRNTPLVLLEAVLGTSTVLFLVIHCLSFIFNAILVYGVHRKLYLYVNIYYFFIIIMTTVSLLIQIFDMRAYIHFGATIEMALYAFVTLCFQLYMIALVRSLLRKLVIEEPHVYDNPLQQIVTGETKLESNGIYNDTTVEPINL